MRLIVKDKNGNTLPGENLYYHESGYNNIKVPNDVQDIVKYRLEHKRKVRASRNGIITDILNNNKVVINNFKRYSGVPNTEPTSAKNRNKNLRKVFTNVKDFTLAVATSSGILKRSGDTVPGLG